MWESAAAMCVLVGMLVTLAGAVRPRSPVPPTPPAAKVYDGGVFKPPPRRVRPGELTMMIGLLIMIGGAVTCTVIDLVLDGVLTL